MVLIRDISMILAGKDEMVISKNVISKMSAQELYVNTLAWAEEYDFEFATYLKANNPSGYLPFRSSLVAQFSYKSRRKTFWIYYYNIYH